MVNPVLSISFWKQRLEDAKSRGEIHRAIYECSIDQWREIEDVHRKILSLTIEPDDSILDAGCGWGRLLDLLPLSWHGEYLGVDISPEFISLAKETYPRRNFVESEIVLLAEWTQAQGKMYDWGVCVSLKRMLLENAEAERWRGIEKGLSKVCRRVLILEYSPNSGKIWEIT